MNSKLFFTFLFVVFLALSGFVVYNKVQDSKKTTEGDTQQTTDKTPVSSSSCIVTIDGVNYDVTKYRKQHSGGDIFKCGTDMTKIFDSEHGARELRQMQQYKVN